MDSGHLTPRERWLRLAAGAGLIAGGCIFYGISQAHDAQNRGALVGIIAVIVGLSWAGQGLRGRREGAIDRVPGEEAPRRTTHPPISAERTVAGILLAWLLPGAGHWIIGRRAKAVLFFVTITVTFLLGIALAEGRNMSYERDKVYFLAYMFNAGQTGLAWMFTKDLELTHAVPYLQLGFLYTAVACLLNVVAMMDFVSTCGVPGGPAALPVPGGPEAPGEPVASDGPRDVFAPDDDAASESGAGTGDAGTGHEERAQP